MWRNDRSDSGNCASSSGFGKLLSLVGGIGLGAGLLYLLDPESGTKRRRSILRGVQGLGSGIADKASGWLGSAGDYASDAYDSAYDSASSGIGSVGSTVGKYLGKARDYAADKSYSARRYAVESMGGEMPHSHVLGQTVCALGSMALGAALMYVFDPASGKNRRMAAQTWSKDHLGQYSKAVSGAVGTGYKAVADTVSSGYQSVSGAVANVASKVGIGGGEQGSENKGGGDTVAASQPSAGSETGKSGGKSSNGGSRRAGSSSSSNAGSDRVGGTTTF